MYTLKCNLTEETQMEATTKDLRLHTPELLAATDRGETVFITYRGKRRVIMRRYVPGEGDAEAGDRNPAFGIWADRHEAVDEQVRQLRTGRRLP